MKGTRDFTEAEQNKLAQKPGLEKQTAELEATVAATGGDASSDGGGGSSGGGGGSSGAVGSAVVEAKRKAAADRIGLAEEYIALNKQYPSATMSSQIFHVRRICKDLLTHYQLLNSCIRAKTASKWHVSPCDVV